MRDFAAAQAAGEVSQAELREVREREGWFSACDRVSGQRYCLRWLTEEPRTLTKHGLCGFAEIRDHGGGGVFFERGRVHFCTRKPCGTKFDPRREPTVCHAIEFAAAELPAPAEALEMCGLSAPAEALEEIPQAPAAPAEGLESHGPPALAEALAGHPQEEPLEFLESAGDGPPALAEAKCEQQVESSLPEDNAPASPDIFADLATPSPIGPLSFQARSRSRTPPRKIDVWEEDSPALFWAGVENDLRLSDSSHGPVDLSCEPPSAPAGVDGPAQVNDVETFEDPLMIKRAALALLLEEEAHGWAEPGFYLPLMALTMFAFKRSWRLKIMVGEELVDVLDTYSP